MSIRQRKTKNGVTYQVYFPCHSCLGGVYRQGGFKTKTEAKQHEIEAKSELLRTGRIQKEVKKTVNEVFDEFISVADSDFQWNSIESMARRKTYFKDNIGRMYINDVQYIDLQRFFDSRKDLGLCSNKKIYNALMNTFKHARRCGYTQNDPIHDVKVKGKSESKEKQPISEQDFLRVVEKFKNRNDFKGDSLIIALYLGYFQGLRLSEVFALEKKDFDLDKGTVSINKKLNYKSLNSSELYVTQQLKSKSSKATLPLATGLTNLIKEWFSYNPYDKVICDEEGNYIHPNCFQNLLKKISKELGITFTFHLLRHTFATNCELNGVAPKEAQMLLRHSDFNTTLSVYTHVNEERKKQAINKVFDSKSVAKVSQEAIKIKTLA